MTNAEHPLRVRITYDVETSGAMEKRELPFVVGVVADLSGLGDAVPVGRTPLKSREFVEIDRDNFETSRRFYAPSPSPRAEATWRGIAHLVMKTDTSKLLKLRVLDATEKELREDFARATAFDQSALFKTVYEATYGTYGGEPFGLLVTDYYFERDAASLSLLKAMAAVAGTSNVPLIGGAAPSLYDGAEPSAEWDAFRESEDGSYAALVMPRMLLPGQAPDAVLWCNPAFALAQRITNAVATYGWPAAIHDIEGGGLVEGLAVHRTVSAGSDTIVVGPTETVITEGRHAELEAMRLIPLTAMKGGDTAVFFGSRGKLVGVARLAVLLCASRFAQYAKVVMRGKIGTFMSRANVEAILNSWIGNYVLVDDKAPLAAQAAFPLRAAQIVVTEVAGQPGSYRAVMFLRPHFQIEELTVSIRLVVELPAV